MSSESKDLSVLSYANGFTLWYYKTETHNLNEVLQDGYFNSQSHMIGEGDHIHVNALDLGGLLDVTQVCNDLVVVKRMN